MSSEPRGLKKKKKNWGGGGGGGGGGRGGIEGAGGVISHQAQRYLEK